MFGNWVFGDFRSLTPIPDEHRTQPIEASHLAEKILAPVLLAHGEEDDNVEPAQAGSMRRALERAGRPPEFLLVSGEGHVFYKEANRIELYRRIETFLAKHLRR